MVDAYLVTNPRFDEPGQPYRLICNLEDDTRIGCLWKSNKAGFIGRVNTAKPLALFAVENEHTGRLVVKRRRIWVKPPVNPVALVLRPYGEGDGYYP